MEATRTDRDAAIDLLCEAVWSAKVLGGGDDRSGMLGGLLMGIGVLVDGCLRPGDSAEEAMLRGYACAVAWQESLPNVIDLREQPVWCRAGHADRCGTVLCRCPCHRLGGVPSGSLR